MCGRSEAASESGGGVSGAAVDGDGIGGIDGIDGIDGIGGNGGNGGNGGIDTIDGLGGALDVGLAGCSGNDSADESADQPPRRVGGARGLGGADGGEEGEDEAEGEDVEEGEDEEEEGRQGTPGGVPPRQSRQALGGSPSSYAELDTMMEHIIPNLGHFPRSDASVAFALNELDTLLSDEVRCVVWWCGGVVFQFRTVSSTSVVRCGRVGGGYGVGERWSEVAFGCVGVFDHGRDGDDWECDAAGEWGCGGGCGLSLARDAPLVVVASCGFYARVSVDRDCDHGGVAVADGDGGEPGAAGGVLVGAWA